MSNEIQIIKEKVDFLKIIDLIFKKQDWGKSYILYKYGYITVKCCLSEINFLNKQYWFLITIEYNYNDKIETEKFNKLLSINDKLSQEDILNFEFRINKEIISKLEEIEKYQLVELCKNKYKYYYSFSITDKIILASNYSTQYKKFCDIENDILKEKCIDDLKEIIRTELNQIFFNNCDVYKKETNFKIKYFDEFKEEINKIIQNYLN